MVDDAPSTPAIRTKASEGNKKDKKPDKKSDKKPNEKKAGTTDTKGLTVTRAQDFGLWYTELVTKGGIISYYDVQDM